MLDVMLPRLDGLAKNGALEIVAGINAGARHYVVKPFRMEDLLARLDDMVVRRT
jgi:DNA-binding response OmpR family regulator